MRQGEDREKNKDLFKPSGGGGPMGLYVKGVNMRRPEEGSKVSRTQLREESGGGGGGDGVIGG